LARSISAHAGALFAVAVGLACIVIVGVERLRQPVRDVVIAAPLTARRKLIHAAARPADREVRVVGAQDLPRRLRLAEDRLQRVFPRFHVRGVVSFALVFQLGMELADVGQLREIQALGHRAN